MTDRINLLSYADNWRYMQDHEIELFMREEWHKNRLLLDLLALWTVNIEDFDLMTLEDFQEHYKEQKDFVANVTYILFEHSLTLNKTDWKKRLVKSVAHFILTDNAHWPVVRQVLMMLLPKEYSEPLKVDCYDIQRLKINQ